MMEFVQRLVYLIWKRFSIQCIMLTQRPRITFKKTFLDRQILYQYWRYSFVLWIYRVFPRIRTFIYISVFRLLKCWDVNICCYVCIVQNSFMQPSLAISYEMAWPHMNNEALVVIYGMRKQILLNVNCEKHYGCNT